MIYVLVTGQNTEDHLKNLEVCLYLYQSNTWDIILTRMAFTHQKKVKAVKDAPTPSNITELKAYLGTMENFFQTWPRHWLPYTPC